VVEKQSGRFKQAACALQCDLVEVSCEGKQRAVVKQKPLSVRL
jgi:hypothetical protein